MPITIEELNAGLEAAHVRQRKWDLRFLSLASMVSGWSKDPSTKCGAVIVRPDLTVASVGYNGFPRGCDDDPEIYANRELKYARVVHAEVNAILACERRPENCTLYTWPPGVGPSCDRCTTYIIQAGIGRVVHILSGEFAGGRWDEAIKRGLRMYQEAEIQVTEIPYTEFFGMPSNK